MLVTGNPANTNALIAKSNAPDIPAERFNALTRLDHNRALAQLAAKTGTTVNDIKHADDLGQPLRHAVPGHLPRGGERPERGRADRRPGLDRESTFIPTVQQRGAAIIEARGASSAASAANATVDHMRDWVLGTPGGRLGLDVGAVRRLVRGRRGHHHSLPVHDLRRGVQIVQGLEINEFSRGKIDASVAELGEEREAVRSLGLVE